jgi:N-acetylglucosaminyl-diphospho-decaprenol L-rhamnosyltransferase
MGESVGAAVSVCIVNWNARESLLRCLASLQANPPTGSWECIVVDNASTDGSVEQLRREAPWATVIANTRNVGLAAGNNQAIRAAGGEFLLLSNADVRYTRGALDALRTLLERRPRAAFAVPRLLHPDGALQTSAGSLPGLREAFAGRAASHARGGREEGFWWDGWAHDEERQIGHGAESAYMVRRAAVEEIGPQDERFQLDWEGIEWSARAGDRGWEIWFCPAAEVIHEGGVSIKQVPVRWVIRSHLGMYRYFAPRSPRLLRPALGALVLGRAAAKLGMMSLRPMYDRANRGPRG